MIIKNKTQIVIILGFILSILISLYNIEKHDRNIIDVDGKHYHKMIKYDAYRYLSHGDEIKNQLKEGINFFKTGREHYTKYLPPRLMAAYYYIFDLDLFEDESKVKVKTNIHFKYLLFQCFIYFFCVWVFYLSLSKQMSKDVIFFIVAFLCLEPTINQYHSTFWSESIFFSIQILLTALILKKENSILNFGLIGFFLAILSFQKEYSIFYILFIFVYFILIKEKRIFTKFTMMLLLFILVQSILGFNNYFRSGKFYIMTADSKVNIYNDMVIHVMVKKYNISHRKFVEMEGKEVLKWLNKNSIEFEKDKLNNFLKINKYDSPSWIDYRDQLEEKDKIRFDNFIRNRTLDYILEYPVEFIFRIIKNSIHITLLNPFHIYSDHNFKSGEMYYFSEKHDQLVKYRIIYTLIIYTLCLIGLIYMIKKKEYKILFFLSLSIAYFYGLVSWNGNTRYFVPAFIYASFFFGFGIDKVIKLKQKK